MASAYPGGPLVSMMLLHYLDSIASFAHSGYDWEFEITCLLRTPEENDACYDCKGDHMTGVHVVGRGADIHTLGVPPAVVEAVVKYVNEHLIYDPNRPEMVVALLEGAAPGAGSTAPHLHIQVHPSTQSRQTEGQAL